MALVVEMLREAILDCQRAFSVMNPDELASLAKSKGISTIDMAQRLQELTRGFVVKLISEIIDADHQWSPPELHAASYLIERFWQKSLAGDDLKTALRQLSQYASQLEWDTLVQPLMHCSEMGARRAALLTAAMRVANLVAKADGNVDPKEVAALQRLEDLLARALDQPRQQVEDIPVMEVVGEPVSQQGPTPAIESSTPVPSLETCLAELDALIGLSAVKKQVRELADFLQLQKKRAAMDLPNEQHSLHMTFVGNPGTGKTTVARILAGIFRGLEMLKSGHLLETDRSGLVAEFAGQTANKTATVVQSALDGVLFIDEAYSLVNTEGDDPYGHEAVQILLKRMEDLRSRLIVILAGYPLPMDKLLRSNPGLSSRISMTLQFVDYSPGELLAILRKLARDNRYCLTPQAETRLLRCLIESQGQRDEHFGNGRVIRNLFEQSIRRMATRIAAVVPITEELLTRLEVSDLAIQAICPENEPDAAPINDGETKVALICSGCQQRIRANLEQVLQERNCPKCDQVLSLATIQELELSPKE